MKRTIAACGLVAWALGVSREMSMMRTLALALAVIAAAATRAWPAGYPQGAIVADPNRPGLYWFSQVDNNTTNPTTGGANWLPFNPSATLVTGQVYFEFTTPTSVALMPFGGSSIVINKIVYHIPSAGISCSNTNTYVGGVSGQSLGNDLVYDVFLFNDAGMLTCDYYLISGGIGSLHEPDTTAGNVGIEVRNNSGSADSTRSFIGMVLTNSSGQFQGQGTGTISWFNQQPIVLGGTDIDGPINISSPGDVQELTSSARISFLCFASSGKGVCSAQISLGGNVSVSAETAMASFGILLNSGVSYTWVTQSLNRQGMTPAITAAFSEGSNWASPGGALSGSGTASFGDFQLYAMIWG